MNLSLGNKKTLLVVDDEPMILNLLSDCLSRDFSILIADSGENALEQSRTFAGQIHLLLTDIKLPGMSGVELANQITAQRPGIKVVLMSGGELPMSGPGWPHLRKPFNRSQLMSLVNAVLSSPRSNSTTV